MPHSAYTEPYDLQDLRSLTFDDIHQAKKQLTKAYGLKKPTVLPKQTLPFALPTIYNECKLTQREELLQQVCVQECPWTNYREVKSTTTVRRSEVLCSGNIRGYQRNSDTDVHHLTSSTIPNSTYKRMCDLTSLVTRTSKMPSPKKQFVITQEIGFSILDSYCARRMNPNPVVRCCSDFFEPSLFEEDVPLPSPLSTISRVALVAPSLQSELEVGHVDEEPFRCPITLEAAFKDLGVSVPTSTPADKVVAGVTVHVFQCLDSQNRLTDIIIDGRSVRACCEKGRRIHGLITAGCSARFRELEWLLYIHFLERGAVYFASAYYVALIYEILAEIRCAPPPSLRMSSLLCVLRNRPDLLYTP